MHKEEPEFELEMALDNCYDHDQERSGTVEVPLYVIEDAIERLKRFTVIVNNLTNIGNFLWGENLRKYGDRKVNPKETPWGVHEQDTYKRMCSFVNEIREEHIQLEDAFVELALSMARINTGDPSGLSQYLEKEDQIFDQLEAGE